MCRFLASAAALVLLFPAATLFGQTAPRLPLLQNSEAWKRLPGAPAKPQTLPNWARMLAGPMPKTTARMLELDAMHRSGDRLDARLRCLVRWAAADANGCAYSKAVAAADLKRARNADADLVLMVKHPEQLPALDRAAVAFARKMMREAHSVTDAEVKQLLELAGEERLVALVTLLAHASFQDHLFLAMNVPPESPDGVPPLHGQFARISKKQLAGSKSPPAPPAVPAGASVSSDWLHYQQNLERQRGRNGRIRIPSREEVLKRIGKDHPSAWQVGINWSRVCYGYQPELTEAWFDCSTPFREEARFSPVFQQSVFWVVTQTLQCFY